MMRAAIYNGKKNILLGELETPKAGEHDIVATGSTPIRDWQREIRRGQGHWEGSRNICCCPIQSGMSRYTG